MRAYQKGIILDLSRPGKPADNVFIESFNEKFRSERLNTQWFMLLNDTREEMGAWCRDYNEVRPQRDWSRTADRHRESLTPDGSTVR